MVGGLYPTEAEEAVIRALCPDNESTRSEPPSILDIGSGSGAWYVEMTEVLLRCLYVICALGPSRLLSASHMLES